MDFFETVTNRRSIRAFLDKKIEPETLHKILETVNLAPSAGNLQAYSIYLVRNKKAKEEFAFASDQEFIAQAPVVFVFSAQKKQSEVKYHDKGYDLYAIQDATIAAAYCQLAATALGLGSVWVGGFDTLEVARLIGAGEHEVPVAIIPVGYFAQMPERATRKELKKIVKEM